MNKRIQMAALAVSLAFAASAAWAKLPPPPPVDPAKKAADDEKKAAAAAKAKQDQAEAEDRAVKNYQANMKKAGKPIPKATPAVAPAAAAKPGDAKATPVAAKAPEKDKAPKK